MDHRIIPIFIIVCLFSFVGCTNVPDNTTTTTTFEKPDVTCFLMHQGLTVMDVCYDEKQQKLDSLSKQSLNLNSKILNVVSLDNYYFLTTSNQLVKLDKNFNVQSSRYFDRVGAISTEGEHLFFSAGDSFFCLDSNLKEVDRLVLKHQGKKVDKRAHDIMLHENEAFLLDNIMMPLYTFRVDVSDPGDMHVVESKRYDLVNGHLDHQWIDPANGFWTLVSSSSHQAGSWESLGTYSLENNEMVSDQMIFKQSIFPNETMEGFRILTNTKKPPLWALVYGPENNSKDLARITYEDDKVIFDRVLDLNLSRNHGLNLVQKKDLVFLKIGSSKVKVIDSSKAEVVADLDISGYE